MTHCSITGGKILSCCYCGVQSSFLPGHAKKVTGGLSTLVCGTCGAPLAAQKARPLAAGKGASLPHRGADAVGTGTKARKNKAGKASYSVKKPAKVKPRKKRKSLFYKLVSEAADLVEDIFD